MHARTSSDIAGGELQLSPILYDSPFRPRHNRRPSSPVWRDSSPTGSTYTAASPTGTLAHFSSPDLPPLPSLPSIPRFDPITPSVPHTDSTYYTASWGSPYTLSHTTPSRTIAGALRPLDWSEELEDDNSPDLRFGLAHLLPSRVPGLTYDDLGNGTPTRPGTPASDRSSGRKPRSQDFDLLSPTLNRERSRGAAAIYNSRQDQRSRSPGRQEIVERTLNFKDRVAVDRRSSHKLSVENWTRGHKSRLSNTTLTQADFPLPVLRETTSNARMRSSRWASGEIPASPSRNNSEKPLPEPPTSSPRPKPISAVSTPARPSPSKRATSISTTSTPARLKKKIPYRGKNCVIYLPVDVQRGGQGQPPLPLSRSEVQARLEAWRQQGYHIDGSDAWERDTQSYDAEHHSLNRTIWPDETERQASVRKSDIRVRISKTDEWDAHVKKVLDDKLRALGVTTGDEEPVPLPFPRSASVQPQALRPFSPPIRTTSAGSQMRMNPLAGMQFAPGFVPGSSNHASRASMAMPLISPGFTPGTSNHNSRASMAMPLVSPDIGGRPQLGHQHRQSMFSAPTLQQIQQHALQTAGLGGLTSPPLMSPGAMHSRSPTMAFGMDLNRLSPGLNQMMAAQQFPQFSQRDEFLAQLHLQQRQQAQIQHLQQQHALMVAQANSRRPSPALPELKEVPDVEVEDVPVRKSSGFEIVNTRPSHKHNISRKLEEDVQKLLDVQDEAVIEEKVETKTEEPVRAVAPETIAPAATEAEFSIASIGIPLAQDATFASVAPLPIVEEKQAIESNQVAAIEEPVDEQPVIASSTREDPLAFKEASVADTSELLSSPVSRKDDAEENPWANDSTFRSRASSLKQHTPGLSHTSNFSLSGLNVSAREFNPKANPSATFNPSIFSGSAFSFQPSATAKPFVPRVGSDTAFSASSSSETPAYVLPPTSNPISASTFNFGNAPRNFSFTASAQAFKPTAAVFSPSSSGFHSDRSIDTSETDLRSSIFGRVNYDTANLGKTSKKPKAAVPIVRPPSAPSSPLEDEDGRPMPDELRMKRTRRAAGDGDQVPQFAVAEAIPSSPPRFDQDFNSDLEANMLRKQNVHVPEVAFPTITDEVFSSSPDRSVIREVVPRAAETKAEPVVSVKSANLTVNSQTGTPVKPLISPRSSSLSAMAAPFVFSPEKPFKSPSKLQHVPVEEAIIVERAPLRPATPDPQNVVTVIEEPTPLRDDYDEETIVRPVSHQSMVSTAHDIDQVSFQDIDAVMQHFDEQGSDAGVEIEEQSWPVSSAGEHPLSPSRVPQLQSSQHPLFRSDAPSPSPRRNLGPGKRLDVETTSHDPFSDTRAALAYESPVHNLNRGDVLPQSEWDDIMSSAEEHRMQARSSFFDKRVSTLISDAISARLSPLEKQLAQISTALTSRPSPPLGGRRVRSRATVDSDADDEDDDEVDVQSRNFSPRRDSKMEKFRAIVQEALASQPRAASSTAAPMPADMSELMALMAEMKTSMSQSTADVVRSKDIEDILARAAPPPVMQPQIDHDRLASLVQSLESASRGLQEEQRARLDMERQLADRERLLKLAEEEIILLKASAQDDGQASITALDELSSARETIASLSNDKTRMEAVVADCGAQMLVMRRNYESQLDMADKSAARVREVEVKLAETSSDRKEKIDLLEADNRALRDTLEEYRISKNKWQQDLHEAAQARDNVQKATSVLKIQMEETSRIKESMRSRIEKLHDDMNAAGTQMAQERIAWQKTDAEHRTKFEVLKARAEAEARTRERLEQELERLEVQEREGMKLRVILEQTQKEVTRLDALAATLRLESSEAQKAADKHASETREARDQGRAELQRTRTALQADIVAANNQVGDVRKEVENELNRLRSELQIATASADTLRTKYEAEMEAVKLEADSAKAKHELEFEEATDTHKDALHKALESINTIKTSFEEQSELLRRQHRRDLDHTIENKNQTESSLRDSHATQMQEASRTHARELEQMLDEKEQSEGLLTERLGLADEKAGLLEDKIRHLEERLEIAKAAANAAALAATSAKTAPEALESREATTPAFARAISTMSAAGAIEKGVNAQALRETIATLQDQLQSRTTHAEQLESQIAQLSTASPETLKQRDTEIAWLRDLLVVRMDDLNEIITSLKTPGFNYKAVLDAAYRVQSNVAMAQSEMQRQEGFSPVVDLPSSNPLASVANFASPKVGQALAAFGNWRKSSGISIPSGLGSVAGTPSRPSTAGRPAARRAYTAASGLMTPPASDLRRTPSPSGAGADTGRPLADLSSRPRPRVRTESESSVVITPKLSLPTRAAGKQPAFAGLTTPSLMRRDSYDQDAEDADYASTGFYDEETSIEGTPRVVRQGRLDAEHGKSLQMSQGVEEDDME